MINYLTRFTQTICILIGMSRFEKLRFCKNCDYPIVHYLGHEDGFLKQPESSTSFHVYFEDIKSECSFELKILPEQGEYRIRRQIMRGKSN